MDIWSTLLVGNSTFTFVIDKQEIEFSITDTSTEEIRHFFNEIILYIHYPDFKIYLNDTTQNKRIDLKSLDFIRDIPNLTSIILQKFPFYLTEEGWDRLSQNPSLTLEIIQKIEKSSTEKASRDRWNWNWLSQNLGLTPEIIREFEKSTSEHPEGRWNWDLLSGNVALTPEIILEFGKSTGRHPNGRWNWTVLSHNPALTSKIIREFANPVGGDQIKSECSNIPETSGDRWIWSWLSQNTSLTSEIIREFAQSSKQHPMGRWDWKVLSNNPALKPEIIVK
jgi:hypothetical protein